MQGRNAVFIEIDGLRASAVGAYGNCWRPTPALDRLASQSIVIEWMWCAEPRQDDAWLERLAAICREVSPQSPLEDRSLGHAPIALTEESSQLGPVLCVTDDPAWAERCRGLAAIECSLLQGEPAGQPPVRSEPNRLTDAAPRIEKERTLEQSCFASLFAHAAEALQDWAHACRSNPTQGHLLWIHSRGMHGPWDAPAEYRAALCEEDDPAPPTWVDPPDDVALEDPEELFAYRVAYAAQVTLLDVCLGAFLAALDETAGESPPLVVLAGCRGFALGEHGRVGREVDDLYGEWLHVPCFVRLPCTEPGRLARLASFDDLEPLLANWLAAAPHEALLDAAFGENRRPYLFVSRPDGRKGLRTLQWSLAMLRDGTPRLFVKPDDRWELNEVADRCPETLAELLAIVRELSVADAACVGPP